MDVFAHGMGFKAPVKFRWLDCSYQLLDHKRQILNTLEFLTTDVKCVPSGIACSLFDDCRTILDRLPETCEFITYR